jgi:hypothetical protein
MEPAYPNPFNGSAVVEYVAPQGSLVEIQVMNCLGQVVTSAAKLGTGQRDRFRWSGSLADGRPASSGTYIVRMKSAMSVQTQKLLFIK